MTVDLGDLVDSLKREVSPPGSNLFPNATDDDWLGHLQDAFWEARLQGMLSGYHETDGSIINDSATGPDMTRDLQQLVVLYAGYRVLLAEARNINASFRVSAGAVSYEVQKSANVLRDVIKAVKEKINIALERLSDVATVNVAVIDSVIERTWSTFEGQQYWVR